MEWWVIDSIQSIFSKKKKNLKTELRTGVNSHKALTKFIAKASDLQSRKDMEYWINSHISWAFNIIANIWGNKPMQMSGVFWHWGFELSPECWEITSTQKKLDYDHSLSSLTLLFMKLVNCARWVTTVSPWDHRYIICKEAFIKFVLCRAEEDREGIQKCISVDEYFTKYRLTELLQWVKEWWRNDDGENVMANEGEAYKKTE